jgi:thiamine-phosphate pyrophosphorylase
MRGLYAIVDLRTLAARGLDPLAFAAAVLVAKPAALQLRAKQVAARELLAMLRALAPMCHVAKVPLVANDRPDLAVLAGCDMVHVGQDDISIDLVHRIAPSLAVGVSTHTPAQLATALDARPAYVAYGPVFATATKADASPVVGVDGLRAAYATARARGIPLVAIGGITLDRARDVASCCDAAAVIADLLPASNDLHETTERARALHDVLSRSDVGAVA